MKKLLGDRAAIAASSVAPPARRDDRRAGARCFPPVVCGQPGEKPLDLAVIREPIQAQFNSLGLLERPLKLSPHRCGIFRRNDGANFRLADHPRRRPSSVLTLPRSRSASMRYRTLPCPSVQGVLASTMRYLMCK